MYRCVATSIEGFIQQIAVSFVLHGYFFYVLGRIPVGKDPTTVDEKLRLLYDLDISKWIRCRRLKTGIASVQYVRYGRVFVLLATEGEHVFLDREKERIQDLRLEPLQCFGYSISSYQAERGKWHPSVRIRDRRFLRLKRHFQESALGKSETELGKEIRALQFAPFAPVRRQYFALLRIVNKRRKLAGLPPVSGNCVRRARKPVRVFGRV